LLPNDFYSAACSKKKKKARKKRNETKINIKKRQRLSQHFNVARGTRKDRIGEIYLFSVFSLDFSFFWVLFYFGVFVVVLLLLVNHCPVARRLP